MYIWYAGKPSIYNLSHACSWNCSHFWSPCLIVTRHRFHQLHDQQEPDGQKTRVPFPRRLPKWKENWNGSFALGLWDQPRHTQIPNIAYNCIEVMDLKLQGHLKHEVLVALMMHLSNNSSSCLSIFCRRTTSNKAKGTHHRLAPELTHPPTQGRDKLQMAYAQRCDKDPWGWVYASKKLWWTSRREE